MKTTTKRCYIASVLKEDFGMGYSLLIYTRAQTIYPGLQPKAQNLIKFEVADEGDTLGMSPVDGSVWVNVRVIDKIPPGFGEIVEAVPYSMLPEIGKKILEHAEEQKL